MRLKNYVFFRETDKGVWFDAGRRSFALNGKGIYPLVERLLSALESSGRSIEEVTAELPEKLQPFAQRLFGELANHNMLHRGIMSAQEASAPEHSAYTEFLKYLEDNIGEDVIREKLDNWRKSTIALTGDGFALKAAAGILADSGCGRIQIYCTATEEVSLEEIEHALSDRGTSTVELAAKAFDQSSNLSGIDGLIVAGSDLFPLDDAIKLGSKCQDAGVPFCAALPVNGSLAVVEMAKPKVPGLADLADWLLPSPDPVTPTSENLAITGSIAAHSMIAEFFDISILEDATARIVSPFSEVSACPIPASPQRHKEGALVLTPDYSSRIEMPEDRELSEYELLRMALGAWTDPAVAVLSNDLPKPLPQLPLYHDVFVVRRPGSGHDNSRITVGWGLDAEDAGIRASMNAMALLAEDEFGPEPTLVASVDEAQWKAAAFAKAVVCSDRFSQDAVWGVIEESDLQLPQAQVALRILKFQVATPIRFLIGFLPGTPAFMAACFQNDECLSNVCSPTIQSAISESIGLAVSKIQLLSIENLVRPEVVLLPERHKNVSLQGMTEITQAAAIADAEPAVRYIRSQRLGLPANVYCGYAILGESE